MPNIIQKKNKKKFKKNAFFSKKLKKNPKKPEKNQKITIRCQNVFRLASHHAIRVRPHDCDLHEGLALVVLSEQF